MANTSATRAAPRVISPRAVSYTHLALLRDEICQNGVFRDLILMAKFEHIQSQEKRNDAEANSR